MQKTSRVPDGGWGWIVSISTFFTSFIVDGVKYSFGIIFIELLNTFQKSKSETSLIMSMQIGAFMLTGKMLVSYKNRICVATSYCINYCDSPAVIVLASWKIPVLKDRFAGQDFFPYRPDAALSSIGWQQHTVDFLPCASGTVGFK